MDPRKLRKAIDEAQAQLFTLSELVEQYVWAVAIEDGNPKEIENMIYAKIHFLTHSQIRSINDAYKNG